METIPPPPPPPTYWYSGISRFLTSGLGVSQGQLPGWERSGGETIGRDDANIIFPKYHRNWILSDIGRGGGRDCVRGGGDVRCGWGGEGRKVGESSVKVTFSRGMERKQLREYVLTFSIIQILLFSFFHLLSTVSTYFVWLMVEILWRKDELKKG